MREQIDIFDIGVEDKHYDYKKYFQDYDKPIKLFEAFAGIGCQAMALKKMNIQYETVGISEIDKHAISSYNAIHGETKNYGDICKMTEIPECDIFTWSFPCTDLSKAGKREGLQGGTRSGLVYEVLRLLHATKDKPKVLIMENVPDLVQETFMAEFYEIQKEIESLGYTNYTQRLNAKHYGVAQNRDRVFMVSLLGGGRYEFPPREKLTKRLKDYLENNVAEKYYLSDKMIKGMQETNFHTYSMERSLKEDEDIANAIIARFEGCPQVVKDEPICLNSKVNGKQPSVQDRVYDTEGTSTAITTSFMPSIAIPEATKKGYSLASDGDGVYLNRPHQKRGVVQKGMIQTLKTSGEDVGVVVAGNEKYISERFNEFEKENGYRPEFFNPYNKSEIKDIAPTITTMSDRWQSSATVAINHNLRIRKLTPRECWRLMGISDEDFDKASKVVSNSQLYKQAGNGIVVDVFAAILKGLF